MPAYDGAAFDPPAPLAQVRLRNPPSGQVSSDVGMLMDSGADVTLVPMDAAASVGLQFNAAEEYELLGFDGRGSLAQAGRFDLLLLGKVFRGRFLGLNQVRGILGRYVLNHLSLVLDGPKLRWDLQ